MSNKELQENGLSISAHSRIKVGGEPEGDKGPDFTIFIPSAESGRNSDPTWKSVFSAPICTQPEKQIAGPNRAVGGA